MYTLIALAKHYLDRVNAFFFLLADVSALIALRAVSLRVRRVRV